MQGEENRKSRKAIYFEKLLVTFPILLHIFFALSFSLCLPSCTTIFQHSPFFPAHSVLSPRHHLCCRCQLCCLVYWCDKSSNQTKASCVMQVTDSWKRALSPLLFLYWQPHPHFIIDEQIRLELGQVTLVDKWMVAVGVGFVGLVLIAKAEVTVLVMYLI